MPAGEVGSSVLRAAILFGILLVGTRLMGKKLLRAITVFDFIIGITIGSMAGDLTLNLDQPLAPRLAGLVAWIALAIAMHFAGLKSRWFAKLTHGEPVILIHNGKILEDKLAFTTLTTDDLMAMLREKGFFDLNEIEFALLEPNGQLSVQPRSQARPVTRQDLGLSTQYEGVATEVVYEGRILEGNLKRFGLDRDWLLDKLRQQGIQDVKEVFYAALDTRGNLYIDRYRDHIRVVTDVSDYPGPN